jgi:hypothetical protein
MNPSDQRFNDRLFVRIAELERQMKEIKTAQPVARRASPSSIPLRIHSLSH